MKIYCDVCQGQVVVKDQRHVWFRDKVFSGIDNGVLRPYKHNKYTIIIINNYNKNVQCILTPEKKFPNQSLFNYCSLISVIVDT